MSLKIRVTPPGIDPGTFRLVTQHLNHYATPDPTVQDTSYHVLFSTDEDGVDLDTLDVFPYPVAILGRKHIEP